MIHKVNERPTQVPKQQNECDHLQHAATYGRIVIRFSEHGTKPYGNRRDPTRQTQSSNLAERARSQGRQSAYLSIVAHPETVR